MTETDLPIQWYVAREGQQYGPLSADEMRLFVQGGHLKTTDLIWRPGFENWRPAPDVFPPAGENPDFGDEKAQDEAAATSDEQAQKQADSAAEETGSALEPEADPGADPTVDDTDAAKARENAAVKADTGPDASETHAADAAGARSESGGPGAMEVGEAEARGTTAADKSANAKPKSSSAEAGGDFSKPAEPVSDTPSEIDTEADRQADRDVETGEAEETVRPSAAAQDESQPVGGGGGEDPVTQPMSRFDQVSARGPAKPHAAEGAKDKTPGDPARQPQKGGAPAAEASATGPTPAGPGPRSSSAPPFNASDPQSAGHKAAPSRAASQPPTAGGSAAEPHDRGPRGTSAPHTPARQEPRGPSPQFDAYGRPLGSGVYPPPGQTGGEPDLGPQIGYAPGPHDLGARDHGPAGPPRGSGGAGPSRHHSRPAAGYGHPQPMGIPGQQRPAPHIPVGGDHRSEPPRNRAGLGRVAGVITALAIVSGLSYATYANREKLNAFITQTGVFGELTQGENATSETIKAGGNRSGDVAMLSKDGAIEQPAPPKPAVDPVIALDEEFQKSPLWKIIKRDFPDWYAARLREVASSSADQTETDVTAQLIKKLVDLRRAHARAALHSSPAQLRNMAQAFLVNLRSLEGHSTSACFSFISRGESSPEVIKLFPDETYGKPIEQQIAAIFLAISNGRASPVKREPAGKPDYDILAKELSKLGWSPADLKLFADPSALSKAEPAKVCNMVQDWFQAHIAIDDTAVQERLLFETLRPVVAG